MDHPQERLAQLRAQVEQINSRYPAHGYAELPARSALRYIEQWLTGEEVETAHGKHFETEKLYASHRRHGSADIGALADLPHDLFDELSKGAIASASPDQWAFLDTETAQAADGGACAFLIGVGRITREGFRVRQFFMRTLREEASVLAALSRHLAAFRVLITYNGRTFDQPLLEARYRIQRLPAPFEGAKHLDLLHGARRLWKLRFESRRLVDLEESILGVERQGDVPGALVPYVYFEYLRTRQAARLLPVFQHNATDILSLACLTAIVPRAFKTPLDSELRHGAEMAAMAGWLKQAGELQPARELLRRAIAADLRDELLFRALWDLASLEGKLGAKEAALEIWNNLAGTRNPFRARALEKLAIYHERRLRDRPRALEFTRAARALADSAALARREARLVRRLDSDIAKR